MFESLVKDIILKFSNKDPEFWEATDFDEISPEDKQLLEIK